MSRLILTNLDLGGNQILGLRVENLAADPSGGGLYEGRIWNNTVTHLLKYYNGSTVVTLGSSANGVVALTVTGPLQDTGTATNPALSLKTGGGAGATNGISDTHVASDAAIAISKLATNPLSRTNHTGTQLAATISDFDTQVRLSRLDQMTAPTADVSLNNRKITTLTDPTGAQDAATKNYVDNVAGGLAPKDAVRVATAVAGTLASSFANGQTVDGTVLATGDRILIKNQVAAAENGIYTVNASGAPTRSIDADTANELLGAACFVSVGTANAATLWVLTTPLPITVNTTALSFAQFGGAGTYTAGTGLSLTGSQFALQTPVSVANGGTNATTAAAARTSLGATTKFAVDVGDGSSTAIVITHNLNTRDVVVQVARNTTPWDEVLCDIERTSVNTCTLRFSQAPTSAQFRATVIG